VKKLLLLLLIVPTVSFGQYSNYYKVDVNSKSKVDYSGTINVNKNVDVSGDVNVNKTITTIDYGALRLANAQREKNRLESIKYNDKRTRAIAIEIANDPSKAVDFGNQLNYKANKKWRKINGFKKVTVQYKELNNLLFQKEGWTYVNYGDDNIRTEIKYISPVNLEKETSETKNNESEFKKMWSAFAKQLFETKDLESSIKDNYVKNFGTVGKKNNMNYYVHFIDITKTRIHGLNGFKIKVVMEDDYEKMIDNTFFAFDEKTNIYYGADCLIKGDTKEVTFEQLEGKNEYFRKLYDKFLGQKGYYIQL
jgi:hypothetical protein